VDDSKDPKAPDSANEPHRGPASPPETPASSGQPRRSTGSGPVYGSAIVPPALHDPDQRERWSLPRETDKPGWYMFELSLTH